MADFNNVTKAFSNGKDTIAVRNYVGGILGGVFLDTTNWPTAQKTIPVLSVVVRNTTSGICSILPLNTAGTNYKLTESGSEGSKTYSLEPASGTEIIGVTVSTILADKPSVGVINAGEINEKVLSFCGGNGTTTGANLAQLKTALKNALPALILNHD